jgi:hypothetical protein
MALDRAIVSLRTEPLPAVAHDQLALISLGRRTVVPAL